ncbi:MAG: thioredoxin family protein [Bacteroidia bacterium]|nr:thioredoxin family protein [Bacteroidia bacterium]
MQVSTHLKDSMPYSAYLSLTEKLVAENKTSGNEQREDLVAYTKLNLQRMQRIGKTTHLLPELVQTLQLIQQPQLWVIITETWCGDAAQNLPIIHLMAEKNPKIQVRIVLRDQHPELMDQYLTNGARSIPKLIVFDESGEKEFFNWGPRPKGAQELAMELKNQGADHETKALAVQKWYLADKGLSMQEEINTLLQK